MREERLGTVRVGAALSRCCQFATLGRSSRSTVAALAIVVLSAVLAPLATPTAAVACARVNGPAPCWLSRTVSTAAIVWFWQGPYRQAQIRGLETDNIGLHHNLEIQPPGGGPTFFNNFHIRYRGVQIDPADGIPKHTWTVDDSVTGASETFRGHYPAYDPTEYGCQEAAQGVVWDIAIYIEGLSNDNPLPIDLLTQKVAPVGSDQSDLLASLQDLCQDDTTPPPTLAAPPTATPTTQSSTVGTPATWSVSAPEDPTKSTTLLFDYGDGSAVVMNTIPQGSGTATFQFQHNFSAEGAYDGQHYRQTFLQLRR